MIVNRSKVINNKKFNSKYYVKGFTLVEISIVLLIIGILTGAVLKGKSIIESVKLDSIVNDVREIQMAYSQYINTTSKKPSTGTLFKDLKEFELIDSETFKTPRIGGKYSVGMDKDNKHPCLKLDNLTEKQIKLLQTKLKSAFGENINAIPDENNTSISIPID